MARRRVLSVVKDRDGDAEVLDTSCISTAGLVGLVDPVDPRELSARRAPSVLVGGCNGAGMGESHEVEVAGIALKGKL